MAGSLGTLWARYKTLFIFWGITLVFIGAALVIQWREADLSNRFVVTDRTIVSGVQVEVTYPSKIFLPSPGAPAQEIIFRVAAPETTKYVLWLESGNGLVFYDDSGEVASPRWEGQGTAVFRTRVQALPGVDEYTIFLDAKLLVDSLEYPIPLGRVVTETLGQFRWRIFGGIFARNIALPLGLLSAVAGWAVTYLGKEADKAETTFRETLSKLSSDFVSDPVFALSQCIEAKEYAEKKHLDNENKEKLANLASRLFQPEARKKIVQQLSELSEKGNRQSVLESLGKVLSFFDDFPRVSDNEENKALASSLQKIHHLLNGQKDTTLAEVIVAVGNMWDKFDVLSAGLVVYSLAQLPRQPDDETVEDNPVESVKNALEQFPHRKRLIRYQQLEWMRDAYGLTLPDEYYFVKPFHHFFETDVIQPNVLYSELFHVEKIVEKGWVNPTQWEHLKSIREPARVIVFEKDAKVLMMRLWKEYVEQQKMPRDGIFPVFWDVKPSELSSSILESISHQVAETWIEFVILNPNAFLDLRPAERDALTGFLGWHVGSVQALNDRLRQRFTQIEKDSSGKENDFWAKERDVLLERMANSSLPYGKDIRPNNEQLLDWLNIRPPWLAHTVLILIYENMPNPEWQQAVSVYQRDLLKQNVVVKEIVVAKDIPEASDLLVRWSDEALLEILKLRVQKTCSRDSFTALFARPPGVSDTLEYDYRLVRQSQGSLGRMLELGQQILLHHDKYHPDSEELQPDDFEVIYQL